MIGAAGGEIVDIETSPDHVSYLHPEDGIVTHSNHFLTAGHGELLLEKLSPNTLHRVDRHAAPPGAASRRSLLRPTCALPPPTTSARPTRSADIPIRASRRQGAP